MELSGATPSWRPETWRAGRWCGTHPHIWCQNFWEEKHPRRSRGILDGILEGQGSMELKARMTRAWDFQCIPQNPQRGASEAAAGMEKGKEHMK